MKKSVRKRKKSKRQAGKLIVFLLIGLGGLLACNNDEPTAAPWELEVARLKTAVEPFMDFEAAKKAGYDIQATEYRTQMGYHFLNATLLDGTFEVEKPEVLIYIENTTGGMELVAVEYGIPIEDLDNPAPPPEGFSGSDDVWKIDTEFSLWTLHAWVVMKNPEGIFKPMNPVLP